MLLLGAVLLMFSSCEKDQISANDKDDSSIEYFNRAQSPSTSPTSSAYLAQEALLDDDAAIDGDDELVSLEIPEEYLAGPDQEMILIIENGPFYTEEGDEEVEGTVEIEMTAEGDAFSRISVSQNLIDYGIVNPGLVTLAKSYSEYYEECMRSMCNPPPPGMSLQSCHNNCAFSSVIAWIFQLGED